MKQFPASASALLLHWSQGPQADEARSMDAAQPTGGKVGPTSSSPRTRSYTSHHSKSRSSTMAGIRISKEVLLFSEKKAQGNSVNTFESKRGR